MQLCTVATTAGRAPAVRIGVDGVVLVSDLVGRRDGDLLGLLTPESLDKMSHALATVDTEKHVIRDARAVAPYRRPRKILGIGLNYRSHAGDLKAESPQSSPASFLKGDHTIIGPDEDIVIPAGIGRVTAEAELGLVIGKYCHRVSEEDALSHVAGVCAVLDQTAEEVLMENPRFLTRVKNYPTFFSFGPNIVTMDEVLEIVGDLNTLSVATIHNGTIHRQDVVAGMTFSPAQLLSFHSHVMPFFPGDILATGTPGAVAISPGDHVQCELGDGLAVLSNSVVADGDQSMAPPASEIGKP